MDSEIVLSQADGRPMYLQIIEQIKRLIAVGDWPAGYKLPSIREFAVALKVSVITVKRAYQDLEQEGVIVTQQGKGSFVAHISNMSEHLWESELDDHLAKIAKIAEMMAIDEVELIERLKFWLQES